MALMRPILAVSLALFALACSRNKTSTDGSGPAGSGAPAGELAAAANLASPLSVLNGFEGQIDLVFKESAPKAEDPVPLTLLVKGDKLRVDVPEKFARAGGPLFGTKPYAILDPTAKKLSIVSDEQKQAVVIDLEKSGEQLKNMRPPQRPMPGGAAPPPKAPPKLTETGKYDTVAGERCENWDITDDHRDATVCIADHGASFLHIPLTGIPTEQLWMTQLLDGRHFPLRLISYAKDGATENSRVEVTHIDKKSPPASAFEYPPSYRVMDLAQMLGGLMSFPPGGRPFGGPPRPPVAGQ